jgi:hypothetical protein
MSDHPRADHDPDDPRPGPGPEPGPEPDPTGDAARGLVERGAAPGPAILHEFTVVRAELLLLAEDLAEVNAELDHVREGTHPWVERVDADLAAVRGSLVRIGEDVAAATIGVHQVLEGIEHLVRLADGGSASTN